MKAARWSLLVVALLFGRATLILAGGTVYVCDEPNLDVALVGGGTVTFACDGTIALTSSKFLSYATTLDATGHSVTLDGGNNLAILYANAVVLTLHHLTLAHGRAQGLDGSFPGDAGGDANGGAVFLNSGFLFADDVRFDSNSAVAGNGQPDPSAGASGGAGGWSYGGAIYNLGGQINLTNCVFTGNTAAGGSGGDADFAGAGGSASGGAIFSTAGSLDLRGVVFAGNSSAGGIGGAGTSPGAGGEGNGGAIDSTTPSPTARDCTFGGNVAAGGSGQPVGAATGGGWRLAGGALMVGDSIFWGNLDDAGGASAQITLAGGSATVGASDVQGGWAGAGNISADPVFVDIAAGNLHLQGTSPCIDAGDNSLAAPGLTVDVDGDPRFVDDQAVADTGTGTAPIIDMGADEFVPPITATTPASQTVRAGSPVQFSTFATGLAPLTYQWRRDGAPLSDGGAVSGATTATLTIDPVSVTDAASSPGYDVVVTDARSSTTSGAATLTVIPPGAQISYYTITPCRLIDTRRPAGTWGGPALSGGGATRDFPIDGQCGIPADAAAVSVNVTVAAPTGAGDLRLYPQGIAPPTVSTINFPSGRTRANNAIIPLTGVPLGALTVKCDIASGTTQFLFDVGGYFR